MPEERSTMSWGVSESNESPSTSGLDRMSVVAETDEDIVRHIHEETDCWSSVLIHTDNDRRYTNIHRDSHRCLEHRQFVCNCSIDVRNQVHRLDSDSTSSVRSTVVDTKCYGSPRNRAGLEEVPPVRCVDHVH